MRWIMTVAEQDVINSLPDHLRIAGDYTRLLARARGKQSTLESSGLDNPSLADAQITEEELFQWYFENCLGRAVADDIETYARSVGFSDQEAFRRAVLREFCYSSRNGHHETERAR